MGCWTSACALSGLTIPYTAGRVGVIFLMSGYDKPVCGASYTDGLCRWVSPPLWGVLDSYGRVEVDEDEDPQTIALTCAALTALGVAPAPTTAKDLFGVQTQIHDAEGLPVEEPDGPGGSKAHLGYALVREDVWKAFVDMAPGDEPAFQVDFLREWLVNRPLESDGARTLTYYFLGMGGSGITCPTAFEDFPRNLKGVASDALLARIIELRRVQYAMGGLRLALVPACGVGSQNDNTVERRAYFKAMEKIAERDYAQAALAYEDEEEEAG